MAEPREFRFEIADLKPTTLSMSRLQHYLPHLIEIFGNHDDVHLMRVADGSATPCIFVKPIVELKVDKRLLSIKTGHVSRKAYKALESLNDLLAEDETSAVLRSPSLGVVIEFPGNKQNKDIAIGPISETCDLQGELILVGGRDETISLYLRNEDNIYICSATREQGKEISKHLFKSVRVHGDGKWIRRENGKWKLMSFTLNSFMPLSNIGLGKTVDALRLLGRTLNVKPDMALITDDE